ncbi:hypothetical protein RHMOL_Rhmol12G0248600 [Rhododendron molle]|uniref:Uncharacterized protein n=1 Tax=Rhododendron molle TaxID=49168 RepID=A0ACC0LM82_RHOML|nr:hypothetical protein RHMOL_Rhmol12G0248600 [Rhododendron molle]
MAKVAVNTFLFLRRTYTVAAENVRVGTAAVGTKKAADSSRVGPEKEASPRGGKREDVFWMRDPKTGNWIPETHFGEVDVADLREKYLVKKANL